MAFWLALLLVPSALILILLLLLEVKGRRVLAKTVLVDPSHLPSHLVGSDRDKVPTTLTSEDPLRILYRSVTGTFGFRACDVVHSFNTLIKPTYFLGARMVLIWDAEVTKRVLANKGGEFGPLPFSKDFERLAGTSVLMADDWKQQRNLLGPAFHSASLKSLVPCFQQVADKLADKLDKETDQPVEVHHWMQKATLDAIGKAGFGYDFETLDDKISSELTAYETIFRVAFHPMRLVPLVRALPLKINKELGQAFDHFESFIGGVIKHKKAKAEEEEEPVGKEAGKDVLDKLVQSNSADEGFKLTDIQLMHNVNVFFVAGHETSAGALVFTLHLLASHEEEQRKVQAELDQVLGGRKATYEDLDNLPYLLMVVKESLRLFPPVASVIRKLTEDVELNGYQLFKGDWLQVSMWALHHSERYWGPDADKFNPERFSSENSKGRHPFAWLPFLGGPRSCIGSHFALIEMRIMLATLLQRFTFRPNPSSSLEMHKYIVLRPTPGFTLMVERRKH